MSLISDTIDERHESVCSHKIDDTSYTHSKIQFSRNFGENLTNAAATLLERCLGEDVDFLAELAATLSDSYQSTGNNETLPTYTTSPKEIHRIIQARNQIHSLQCSSVKGTLNRTIYQSPISDYYRFLAELRQMSRDVGNAMFDEKSAAETGLLGKQPGFETLRHQMEEKYSLGQLDAFSIYLLGLVYKGAGNTEKAKHAYIESIRRYPLLWPSWKGLLSCFDCSLENLQQELHISGDLKIFFLLEYSIMHDDELQSTVTTLSTLLDTFPNNIEIHGLLGRAYANNRNTELSISALERVQNIDPSCVKYMDILSNQYFMSQSKAKLAALVHDLWKTEKYCFETCMATANYYSLRAEKSTAIEYFERAMLLRPSYYDAWTLIGHEYIELRNFSQGIHSYRMAIAGNEQDHRAWYGLGQAYEMLKIHTCALTHYLKALNLRPNNDRICEAVGDSYEKLEQFIVAKRYFKRAARLGQFSSASCLSKIARVCKRMKNDDKAAKYYEMYVQAEVEEDHLDQRHEGYSDAYLFLAHYYIENKKDYATGAAFAKKCVWYIPTRDEGSKLLKKLPNNTLFPSSSELGADGDIPRRPNPLGQECDPSDSSGVEKKGLQDFSNWGDFIKANFE